MRTASLLLALPLSAGCTSPFALVGTGGAGGSATTSSSASSGTGGGTTASSGTMSSSSGNPCGTGNMSCNGTCVTPMDPMYGCGSPSCTPCNTSHAHAGCRTDGGGCEIKGCDPGWNDCDGSPDNGCEVNGPCPLLTGTPSPVLDTACLAVDSDSVFYTTGIGDVIRVSKKGGAGKTIATLEIGPTGIAVDGGHVFWTTPSTGRVHRANLDGTMASFLYDDATTKPHAMAGDAAHVYWIDAQNSNVWQMNLDGSNQVQVASGEDQPIALAVDSNDIYWTNSMTGDVRKAAKGSMDSASTLVKGVAMNTNGIAVAGSAVFWTTGVVSSTSGAVLTNPSSTPNTSGGIPLAINQAFPTSIAADANGVFWTDSTQGGSVLSAPMGGGQPKTLAQGQAGPRCVAIDATYVYWIDTGTGSTNGMVWKTAR